MSVRTTYDEKRDELKEMLEECLVKAKELVVGTDIWGYDDMEDDYAIEVFQAIKKAKDRI